MEEANGSGSDCGKELIQVQVRYDVCGEEDSDYLYYHHQPCRGDYVENKKPNDVYDAKEVESANVR